MGWGKMWMKLIGEIKLSAAEVPSGMLELRI